MQFHNTSPLASDKEPSQVQPLQSILKGTKVHKKHVTFGKSLSKTPQEQTTNDAGTSSQQDIPKTPTDKAQEKLIKVPSPVWSYALRHFSPSHTTRNSPQKRHHKGLTPNVLVACMGSLCGSALGAPKPLTE